MPLLPCPAAHASGGRFSEPDFAFALAWEVYAPGLGGWTVTRDTDDEGEDIVMVDPPLVYGDGFVLRAGAGGVEISSRLGAHAAPTLREALLLICPLPPLHLEEADRLAAAPAPSLSP